MLQPARQAWDHTWSQPGAQAWYPDEQVVRFLSRYYVQRRGLGPEGLHRYENRPLRGLDLGCGKGRHVVLMAEMGIEAHGTDISEVAIASGREWLAHARLSGKMDVGSITKIDYPDAYFDLVICHGVLDHVLEADCVAAIAEVRRILRPGGRFLVSLISEKDSAYGQGTPIEPDTWLVAEGYEAGIPQAFFSLDRLRNRLKDFSLQGVVEVSNTSLVGQSLIGTDKQYDSDVRYYAIAMR